MILLDTNVVSEAMRATPDDRVVAWMDGLNRRKAGITSITVAEVLYGIGSLPDGARRSKLLEAAADVFDEYLADRIFAFDREAAVEYAHIVIRRESVGNPISMPDAQIAAICLANNAELATRNTGDFENTGVTLLNPWVDA